jgi:hypothetical protein
MLAYLNDDFDGGATIFPRLGLRVRPIAGAALYWSNVLPNGRIDERTFHGGEPVTRGTKLACNIWIHRRADGAQPGRVTLGGVLVPLERREDTSGAVTLGRFLLGRHLGSVSTPESDRQKFGIKIDRRPYPMNSTGTRMTLERMGQMIRDAAVSPSMRQFAEMVVRSAGVGVKESLADRQVGQIFLDWARDKIRYRPDPSMVEYVQDARVTLCVPGAAMCIPVGDCDDLTVALASLMAAYGMDVRLVKQTFNDDADQEHVLIIFRDNSYSKGLGTMGDRWLSADPSSLDTPVGWKAKASKEVIVDPSDPATLGLVDAPQAELVLVGRLGRLSAQSPDQVTTDLTNEFTAVILQADSLLTATPPEYATAIGMYQAAGATAATVLGPEIDSLSPSGATKTFTQTAWTINAALAVVNQTSTATLADALLAQGYARQMLALYNQAISVATTDRDISPTVGIGDVIVTTAAVAVVGGVVWGMWKGSRRKR